jgi:hypothetical protein
MAYNTGNAPGSTHPKDLIDNSEDLDFLMTGSGVSHPNRLGVPLKSMQGMQQEFNADQISRANTFIATQNEKQVAFDAAQLARADEYSADKLSRDTEFDTDQTNRDTEFDTDQTNRDTQFNTFMSSSGLEPPIAYVSGILLDRVTKTVLYLGNEYRVRTAFMPLTTSTWAVDEAKLLLVGDDSLRQALSNPTDPLKGAKMLGWAAGIDMRTKISKDIPSILDYNGHDITGNNDTTAALQAFVDDFKDLVQSGASSYKGGVRANLPKGGLVISSRIKLWSLITLSGAGPFSTIIKAADGWTDGEYMVSASPELDGYGTIRPAVGMRDLSFDHNNTGARGFIGHALNDNCVFSNLRNFNFRKSVMRLGRGTGGGTVSQGWSLHDWHAITAYDVEEDVFITDDANEGLILSCKALGLSSGASSAVGFHIGKGGLSEGVTVLGSSAAHLKNGTGLRFNNTRDCWGQHNSFENVLTDVHIGHASDSAQCSKVVARNNRHYPTVGAPAGQRDIYIDRATSAIGETRENGALEITVNAVNCEGVLSTNRTTGTTKPPTVVLASASSVVRETHKNGTAIHHANASLSMDASATGQFDMVLPGGGFIRGDAFRISVIAATGKGVRLLSNGSAIEASSDGSVIMNCASGKSVTLQENGISKISLDGSGRVRVFGLGTAVPGVPDALYKGPGNALLITS